MTTLKRNIDRRAAFTTARVAAACAALMALAALSPRLVPFCMDEPLLLLGRYLVQGGLVLPRTLELPPWRLFDLAPLGLALALLWGGRHQRSRCGQWLLLAAVTFGATISHRSVWGPHHLAFALFFLALALASAFGSARRRSTALAAALALAVFGFWVSLALRLPSAVIRTDCGFSKDALLADVRSAGQQPPVVEVHTAWGTFYQALLFGPREQIVLWLPRFADRADAIAEVRRIAEATHRGVRVIGMRAPSRRFTPALAAALGPPVSERHYQDWWVFEFAIPDPS